MQILYKYFDQNIIECVSILRFNIAEAMAQQQNDDLRVRDLKINGVTDSQQGILNSSWR